MHFDLNAFVTACGGISGATIVTLGVKMWRVLSRIERRLDQHDIMWEAFCKEHNIPNIQTMEARS